MVCPLWGGDVWLRFAAVSEDWLGRERSPFAVQPKHGRSGLRDRVWRDHVIAPAKKDCVGAEVVARNDSAGMGLTTKLCADI